MVDPEKKEICTYTRNVGLTKVSVCVLAIQKCMVLVIGFCSFVKDVSGFLDDMRPCILSGKRKTILCLVAWV